VLGDRTVRQKGGEQARSTAGAETCDLLTESCIVVAKAFGDILLATVVDADSAKGLVEALGVGGGLQEKTSSWGIVHNSYSRV
jgi:hypothetical protein